MSIEVQPPNSYVSEKRPYLFLAGSIEQGSAEQWQRRVVRELAGERGTILNPRREAWDASLPQTLDCKFFVDQVHWELDAQERADVIACYFDPSTKAPITMLELGKFGHKMIVLCPEGFWRRGNVEIFCRRYHVPFVADWTRFIDELRWRMGR